MKTLKKILSLLLVICMLATVLSFTACGNKDKDGDDDKDNDSDTKTDTTYTVTVTDGEKNPVAGVGIMISTTLTTLYTDENGKITFESATADVKVMIMSTPDGYEESEKKQVGFTSGSTELKLTVEKTVSKVTCMITVEDQNGDTVSGVNLQICSTTCTPGVTNESGVATFKLTPGVEYKVEILSAPDGYSYPAGYLEETVIGGADEFVVTITKN